MLAELKEQLPIGLISGLGFLTSGLTEGVGATLALRAEWAAMRSWLRALISLIFSERPSEKKGVRRIQKIC